MDAGLNNINHLDMDPLDLVLLIVIEMHEWNMLELINQLGNAFIWTNYVNVLRIMLHSKLHIFCFEYVLQHPLQSMYCCMPYAYNWNTTTYIITFYLEPKIHYSR